jgi:hypothetical protein
MIKNLVLLVTLALSLAVATPAQAATYTLELRVQATEPTCMAQKGSIQKTMEDAGSALGAKLAGIRVSCLNEFSATLASGGSYGAYLVSVKFEVEGWPSHYTAHWGLDSTGRDSGSEHGIYTSIDQCASAVPAELKAYETWTGLKPLYWACMPSVGGSSFVLSVTGFGKSARRLHATAVDGWLAGTSGLSAEEIAWLRALIVREGAEIRASEGSRFVYFGKQRVEARLVGLGHWNDLDQCRQQLADGAAIFAGRQMYLSCQDEVLDTDFRWIRMRALVNGSGLYMRDFATASQKYPSFDACRRFLPEVVADSREMDAGFLGAMCVPESLSSGRFAIEKWSRL